ncbi:MAG TPA: DegV family protein [Bacilli bacterium]|jgi:DegV family protein with EDD domain|nr:DegV family protein [Bacilli bacterium]MDD3068767.1 DegV family protein [Bacilli bacterium]MDD3841622.1 DegV family protein [Bacilli bacterium]HKM30318.1 DegV family protein [Bacilli bacterium]
MKNKSSIGIVIDSTTTLDPQLIKEYDIEVVSLNIHTQAFNKREIDTLDEEIIPLLDDVKNLSTSSPSPNDFAEAYNRLFQKGYKHIICLPLSKEISSTYQSALIGKTYVDNADQIFVGDTLICNYGLANLVETLLPLFESKLASFGDIVEAYNQRIGNTAIQFSVLNLKHLVNGGRLSKIAGLLGAILHIKPIIEMQNGKLRLFKKELNMAKVIGTFINTIKSFSDRFTTLFVKIVDLQQNDLAEKLVNLISTNFPKINVSRIRTVRPVYFIHLGNNGLGISVVAYNS